MKKAFLLFAFICYTFTLSAQKQTYSIGILLDTKAGKMDSILVQLREQIKGVVGEDANIVFQEENVLVNNFNLEQAAQNYDQLRSNSTDIILAFGPFNNVIVSQQSSYPKPTILFGAVNRDLVAIAPDKTSSGIDNFTYLIVSESYQEDIKKLKELTDFKNLGIVIEQPIVNILPLKEIFDKTLQEIGADYKIIPFNSITDIPSGLSDIDAVYLAGGFFLKTEALKQLANTFIEKKLPAFTATSIKDVENGFFATNREDGNLSQFQRRIALSVEAYINGTNLSELPVFMEYTPRLTINYNTAELVGVPIKYSLTATTDFVGEFKNAISEKEYNLLSAISQAIGKNLTLSSSKKSVELSAQDITIAKSDYLPKVEASLSGSYVDPDLAVASFGQNPEFSTSGSITATQLLYSQAVKTNIAIQKKLLKAEEQSLSTTQLDLIADVSSIYLATLISKANAQIQLRNLDLTKKNLQIAEQNFDAGESGKSDVLRFRSEIAQNTQKMVEAINQLEQNFVSLNQVLNNPLDMEIDVEDAILSEGIFEQYNYDELTRFLDSPKSRSFFINFLVEEAIKNAPELKNLDYAIGATEHSIDLYDQGRYYPTVSLQGQYNRTFNRNGAGSETDLPDGNYNLGVNISLPIFNQNLNNLNLQAATIEKDQLVINRANSKLAISATVRNNVLQLVNQISNIELSKISESTAEESLALTQTSYSSGAVNVIQLIDAQNNYLNARLSRANAIYNFLIDALQLERSMGYFFLLNSKEDNARFRQRFLEYMTSAENN